MQQPTVSVTGTGSSAVVAVDFFRNPFNIGLGVVVTGTVSFTVEYTFSDPSDPAFNAATATWFSTGLTGSATAGQAFTVPCRAIRVTNASGTGTSLLYVQQAGLI